MCETLGLHAAPTRLRTIQKHREVISTRTVSVQDRVVDHLRETVRKPSKSCELSLAATSSA